MTKETWPTDSRFPEFVTTATYPNQATDSPSELTIPCPLDGQPVKVSEGVCWVCGNVVQECGGS